MKGVHVGLVEGGREGEEGGEGEKGGSVERRTDGR